MSSAPSTSSAIASLPAASTVERHNQGSASGKKRLEHAPPNEPIPSTGIRMADSSERPPVSNARNQDGTAGALPLAPPSRNTATNGTFLSPISAYDPPRQLTNEDSAGEYTGGHNSNRMAAESDVDIVEAYRVPTQWYRRPVYRLILVGSILLVCCLVGAVVALVILVNRPPSAASSSSLTSPTPVITTSPERITATPISAPISSPTPGEPPTGAPSTAAPTTPDPTAAPATPEPITATPISSFSPITVVLPTSAPTTAAPTTAEATAASPTPDPITAPPSRVPTTAPPTLEPTVLTPELIACNFLSMRYVNVCRSALGFQDTTRGSTIPSEIGLLTQLKYLNVNFNSLTSTIPSEIGLLTQLTALDFGVNSLTSSIPTEIGLLTQLTALGFSYNLLTSTIPSEIGFLTQLTWLDFSNNALQGTVPSSLCPITPSDGYSFIIVDCFEVTCVSGCCWDRYEDGSLCS
ncbi:hypothetical protein MHU86_23174 [Fragilaria crotonensis]|nr:hypothetical protein MHU86_23174 [Fragilaria crotonensis]